MLPLKFNAGARGMQNLAATAAESTALEASPRASIVSGDVARLRTRAHPRPAALTVISTKGINLVAFTSRKADFSLRSK